MSTLPYVTSPGNVDKALTGIKTAAVPENVSQDFVKTILKIPGGSGSQMTAFLKKLGLANPDGSPNDRYRRFRNPTSSGAALAESIRQAYGPLYVRNEYTHELDDEALTGLVVEETGQAHDATPVRLIVSCFKHLKNFAEFNSTASVEERTRMGKMEELPEVHRAEDTTQQARVSGKSHSVGLNLGYTINLNLPATTDPAVFDAIFRSLKANLLSEDDA